MIKEEKSGRCKFLGGEKEMADILFLNVLDLSFQITMSTRIAKTHDNRYFGRTITHNEWELEIIEFQCLVALHRSCERKAYAPQVAKAHTPYSF